MMLSSFPRHPKPSWRSITESIAKLSINLSWRIPVETAERLAIVEIHSTIGHIQGVQRCGESVAEILAEGKIESCVLRQMVPCIRPPRKGIAEPGAVVDVGRGIGSPRKNHIATEVEGIVLIVIKRE